MSRIVLDTNVVIAAFATRGLCESVFELCLERHEIVLSDFLIRALEEKLKNKIKLPDSVVEEILQWYTRNSLNVRLSSVDPGVCRDPKDASVIGTCLGGGAELLITGDKDLLVLESFGDTRILTLREFYVSQIQQ